MKKLILAAILLGVSAQAMATDWYIFEMQSEKCVEASGYAARKHTPSLVSPYRLRIFMRQAFPATYGGTSVLELPQGGRMVEIKVGKRAISYFSSRAGCLYVARILHKKDLIPNLGSLK